MNDASTKTYELYTKVIHCTDETESDTLHRQSNNERQNTPVSEQTMVSALREEGVADMAEHRTLSKRQGLHLL